MPPPQSHFNYNSAYENQGKFQTPSHNLKLNLQSIQTVGAGYDAYGEGGAGVGLSPNGSIEMTPLPCET
jgi:hypothetical protein